MDAPTKPTKTAQRWFEHVRRCEASGQSVQDYARAHGLSAASLYAYRSRAKRAVKTAASTTPAFIPVRVTPQPASVGLRVTFANGVRVELAPPSDAHSLAQLLRLVQQLP
jgi:transposase-like protein